MTQISAGLSTAAMIRAARTTFSLEYPVSSRKTEQTGHQHTKGIGNRGGQRHKSSSYQVLPMLITLIPSGRVFHKYGSMCT
jgi:hypothetical protein